MDVGTVLMAETTAGGGEAQRGDGFVAGCVGCGRELPENSLEGFVGEVEKGGGSRRKHFSWGFAADAAAVAVGRILEIGRWATQCGGGEEANRRAIVYDSSS